MSKKDLLERGREGGSMLTQMISVWAPTEEMEDGVELLSSGLLCILPVWSTIRNVPPG